MPNRARSRAAGTGSSRRARRPQAAASQWQLQTDLAGTILWLPPQTDLSSHASLLLAIDEGCYNHPVVVLSSCPDQKKEVKILIVTSFHATSLSKKYPHNPALRKLYLPIHPAPLHPDLNGIVLHLESSRELLRKSYVNLGKIWSVPLKVLGGYPYGSSDPRRKRFKLTHESMKVLMGMIGANGTRAVQKLGGPAELESEDEEEDAVSVSSRVGQVGGTGKLSDTIIPATRSRDQLEASRPLVPAFRPTERFSYESYRPAATANSLSPSARPLLAWPRETTSYRTVSPQPLQRISHQQQQQFNQTLAYPPANPAHSGSVRVPGAYPAMSSGPPSRTRRNGYYYPSPETRPPVEESRWSDIRSLLLSVFLFVGFWALVVWFLVWTGQWVFSHGKEWGRELLSVLGWSWDHVRGFFVWIVQVMFEAGLKVWHWLTGVE
ncbi:hypothetical protein QBC43DRAFT_317259 [Cladorrhinum sp. PSN259]|nr:hypothetical protein QBC43DRAFT_317259 [Cladorrhinum sp. PSN259]